MTSNQLMDLNDDADTVENIISELNLVLDSMQDEIHDRRRFQGETDILRDLIGYLDEKRANMDAVLEEHQDELSKIYHSR